MELALSMIAVVISVLGVVFQTTSAKRIEKAVTAFVVEQATGALNNWAKSFEHSAEQVIKMVVGEKMDEHIASQTKPSKTPVAKK